MMTVLEDTRREVEGAVKTKRKKKIYVLLVVE
jgi:hypothetical protein